MTTTERYNPRESEDYGICIDCDAVFLTEQEQESHMSETLKTSTNKRSHSVRTINPSRLERIDNAIDSLVEDAMDEVCRGIDDLISFNHITEEEALQVIRRTVIDLENEWDNYND